MPLALRKLTVPAVGASGQHCAALGLPTGCFRGLWRRAQGVSILCTSSKVPHTTSRAGVQACTATTHAGAQRCRHLQLKPRYAASTPPGYCWCAKLACKQQLLPTGGGAPAHVHYAPPSACSSCRWLIQRPHTTEDYHTSLAIHCVIATRTALGARHPIPLPVRKVSMPAAAGCCLGMVACSWTYGRSITRWRQLLLMDSTTPTQAEAQQQQQLLPPGDTCVRRLPKGCPEAAKSHASHGSIPLNVALCTPGTQQPLS